MKKVGLFLFVVFFVPFLTPAGASVEVSLINSADGTFVRGTGDPITVLKTFSGKSGPAKIIVYNGGTQDDLGEKVSSSIISVNGNIVFAPSEFSQNVLTTEKTVNLIEGNNHLEVQLKGKPGGKIRIEVLQQNPYYSVMTQNVEGTNFYIGVAVMSDEIHHAEFLDGNYILVKWDNHVSLSQAPQVGDQYTIRIFYKNGTTKDTIYIVTGINNNFVSVSTPDECEIVYSNNFPISWQAAGGTVSSYSIVVTDQENNMVWQKSLDSSTTSVNYNYDGGASTSLVTSVIYLLRLQSYDQNGNQATAVSKFVYNKMWVPDGLSGIYEPENGFNRISWNGNECASAYRLYWGTGPGVTKESELASETQNTVFNHTGVIAEYDYYYRVSAVNVDGIESDLSNEIAVPLKMQ
jgi:hypothetical protein